MPVTQHPFSIQALFNAIKTRPRLLVCILVGLICIGLIPQAWGWPNVTKWTLGWNVGALLNMTLSIHMMFGSTHERMCKRAVREDDGRLILLMMVVISALTCLAAIVAELSIAKTAHSSVRNWHIGLAALTIFSSWIFTQIMFALHYAHDYYLAESTNKVGGLKFPGDHAPDYGDFLYAACVIGTSGQPADVSFTSRTQRRIGLLHSVLSFFFNTVVVALTINIASGLF
jgi:uncharacterized membrane protein